MPDRMPKVSVIMNCYNSREFLREALDSVFAQTFDDFEIVFWDNLSEDGSGDIAKSYGEKVRYFRGEVFLPLYAARNEALARARGEYVAFLDCDDVWMPEKLAMQTAFLESEQDVDFVYTNAFVHDMRHGRKPLFHTTLQPSGDVFEAFLSAYPVGILTVMLRRAALLAMEELFDPRFTLVGDYEFFVRFLYGRKAAYLPRVLAGYRVHGAMTSAQRTSRWEEEFAVIVEKWGRDLRFTGRRLSFAESGRARAACKQALLEGRYADAAACVGSISPESRGERLLFALLPWCVRLPYGLQKRLIEPLVRRRFCA